VPRDVKHSSPHRTDQEVEVAAFARLGHVRLVHGRGQVAVVEIARDEFAPGRRDADDGRYQASS
jgi:hypothetical protein